MLHFNNVLKMYITLTTDKEAIKTLELNEINAL